MRRLHQQMLGGVGDRVGRPAYDRDSVEPGIVHLGLGAFSRAHLAAYTDTVLEAVGGHWMVIGVSLRSAGVQRQLVPQDGLYTLAELSDAGTNHRIIGSVADVLVAPDDPAAVFAAMQLPHVRIVSLTITEKGYCHDSATGELLEDHPDIQWDLAHPASPRTALGFLTEGLSQRFARGVPPFTPLCCDNLADNGNLLRRLTVAFARLRDPQLAHLIEEHVTFPGTMVDRIVPATTPRDREILTETLGYVDQGMVKAEPFSQWVIEDRFVGNRPAWDLAGALFVQDVHAFEEMKLRLLNGSHSAMAYLGCLAGFEHVHEVVADGVMAGFIRDLMDEEISPTLSRPQGIDLAEYKAELFSRFANSVLAHRISQIAEDGSQKLPPRLLEPLRDRIAGGQTYDRIALVVAAWIAFIAVDTTGSTLKDPLADRLREICTTHAGDAEDLVTGFLDIESVFGLDLGADPLFRATLSRWLNRLLESDVREVLRELA